MNDEDFWDIKLDEIQHQVIDAIIAQGDENRIIYSAYDIIHCHPRNNLTRIAIEGDVILSSNDEYISPVLTNPTWLDVAIHANKMVIASTSSNIFLESIHKTEKTINGVDVYCFSMGS